MSQTTNPLASLAILLVEDEFLIAVDAEEILRGLDAAKVEVANTFERAEELARNGAYDAAVLDVNLNGTMSFPIAEILRQRGIPFVFASGYQLEDRQFPGFEGGIYLGKPYTADRLRDRLVDAIRQRNELPKAHIRSA
jgi:DNA-binding response OmpR family regulator